MLTVADFRIYTRWAPSFPGMHRNSVFHTLQGKDHLSLIKQRLTQIRFRTRKWVLKPTCPWVRCTQGRWLASRSWLWRFQADSPYLDTGEKAHPTSRACADNAQDKSSLTAQPLADRSFQRRAKREDSTVSLRGFPVGKEYFSLIKTCL